MIVIWFRHFLNILIYFPCQCFDKDEKDQKEIDKNVLTVHFH